jgi:hypothetical protein
MIQFAMGNATSRRGKGGSDSKMGGEDGEGDGALSKPIARVCLDDFVLLKTVGKGSFGKVVQVRQPSPPRCRIPVPVSVKALYVVA